MHSSDLLGERGRPARNERVARTALTVKEPLTTACQATLLARQLPPCGPDDSRYALIAGGTPALPVKNLRKNVDAITVRRQTDERLQKVLTPDQWTKFQQQRDKMRERGRGGRESRSSNTP